MSRETFFRAPVKYSEGMADDQKDRFIQYLAEQHWEDGLTKRAIYLKPFVSLSKRNGLILYHT
ncbi:hypothetical protein EAJ14_20290 [Parabacteroides distasonis]|nr:hypothetical protein CEQ22_019385 [Parabacteroides distasonis]RGD15753.1 hypothetical protein DW665_16035 [Parabacteroides sp. AM25-14]RGK70549.1 hypothetical protein DXC95_18855 [Parabacteroides sp. 20_3]RKU53017.1 hypothetical protein DWX84_15405 [Parabacteroides sp. AF21-43]RKU76429.1 hypothetical protein DW945_20625 [Parabacteroides sp. AM44-16]